MKKKILSILILTIFTVGTAYSASLSVESDKQEFKDAESKIYLEGDVKIQTGDFTIILKIFLKSGLL